MQAAQVVAGRRVGRLVLHNLQKVRLSLWRDISTCRQNLAFCQACVNLSTCFAQFHQAFKLRPCVSEPAKIHQRTSIKKHALRIIRAGFDTRLKLHDQLLKLSDIIASGWGKLTARHHFLGLFLTRAAFVSAGGEGRVLCTGRAEIIVEDACRNGDRDQHQHRQSTRQSSRGRLGASGLAHFCVGGQQTALNFQFGGVCVFGCDCAAGDVPVQFSQLIAEYLHIMRCARSCVFAASKQGQSDDQGRQHRCANCDNPEKHCRLPPTICAVGSDLDVGARRGNGTKSHIGNEGDVNGRGEVCFLA